MLYLIAEHQPALFADWYHTYGTTPSFYRMSDWRDGMHSAMSNLLLWQMTRLIVQNHRSNSFAALAGWAWIPTDADMIIWALGEQKGKAPWEAKNPLGERAMRQTQDRKQAAKEKLQALFHIEE